MRYLLLVILVGCASTGVVPLDGDTYMIGLRSAQAGYGPPLGAKASVYKEAHEFCKGDIETIEFVMTDSYFARPGSVSLTFRCIQETNDQLDSDA